MSVPQHHRERAPAPKLLDAQKVHAPVALASLSQHSVAPSRPPSRPNQGSAHRAVGHRDHAQCAFCAGGWRTVASSATARFSQINSAAPRYFVDSIPKGAKPADVPVEQPTNFQFVRGAIDQLAGEIVLGVRPTLAVEDYQLKNRK